MVQEIKWMVIINPKSGRNQGKNKRPFIEQELKRQQFNFEIFETEYQGHAINLILSNLTDKYSGIIAVGGDGTLHEVVNGILTQNKVNVNNLTLAVIPLGTGNDWIRTHNISNNYVKAIEQIKLNHTILHDIGVLSFIENGQHQQRYFINSVGIGFDAKVLKYMLSFKKIVPFKQVLYALGIAMAIFNHRNLQGTIAFNNNNIETKMYNLTVGICRYKGGGFMMLPNAIPTDGLLDITLAANITPVKLIRSLTKIISAKVERIKYFEFFKSQLVTLNLSAPVCTEADGEFIGYRPVSISISNQKIRIVTAQ